GQADGRHAGGTAAIIHRCRLRRHAAIAGAELSLSGSAGRSPGRQCGRSRMTVLDGIKTRNFLVIGRVGMDLSPDPAGTRTRDAQSMMVAMGGSSANIAAGLVKLGCKAALVTCVSDDAVGWYCLSQ